MIWNDHSRDFPAGSHAMFSPSQPGWINLKDAEEVFKRYMASKATLIGTVVHEEACECIQTKTKYTKKEAVKVLTKRLVLNGVSRSAFDPEFLAGNFVNYVNDALGYGMEPEKALYYSKWCAGTADAILYDEKKKILRIHDLKTGITPAKFLQLEAYASLFFLEYGDVLHVTPGDVSIELRIFQGGEVNEMFPTSEDIVPIMDKLIWLTKVMRTIEEG